MKITVCELREYPDGLEEDWNRLGDHLAYTSSDLVLLPEMPFYHWFPASEEADPEVWSEAVEAHKRWISRLDELGTPAVLGSRPVTKNNMFLNEGFAWEPDGGCRAVHTKHYLPDEEGFWEASWYQKGEKDFTPVQAASVNVGFLICTEMWFTRHAIDYARQGIQLLASPRASASYSTDKWIAGGRAAAVMSGAYCISSNRGGTDESGTEWGGSGWIIEPEEGRILGLTSREEPFLTLEVDPGKADKAKQTYPRYIYT